jgi:hypothetical protein
MISFALTTAQVRDRSKTVTRRMGWRGLQPGMLLQPVVKAQGLKKGQHVEKIGGPIRVVSVRRERVDALLNYPDGGRGDVEREGFAGKHKPVIPVIGALTTRDWLPIEFVAFFCAANRCQLWTEITRIEFEYLDGASA